MVRYEQIFLRCQILIALKKNPELSFKIGLQNTNFIVIKICNGYSHIKKQIRNDRCNGAERTQYDRTIFFLENNSEGQPSILYVLSNTTSADTKTKNLLTLMASLILQKLQYPKIPELLLGSTLLKMFCCKLRFPKPILRRQVALLVYFSVA